MPLSQEAALQSTRRHRAGDRPVPYVPDVNPAARRFLDRMRLLDDQVLGRPVPDGRSVAGRVLRPRPAVWSGKGRVASLLVLLAMFATLRWLDSSVGADLAFVALWALGLVISFADERLRSREYYRTRCQ